MVVHLPCPLQDLIHLVFFSIKFDLDFIKNSAEVLMKLGMQNIPDVFELESFCGSGFSHPYPRDVSLANVHKPLCIVDKVVNLPFQDGLKVFLHFSAGKLY